MIQILFLHVRCDVDGCVDVDVGLVVSYYCGVDVVVGSVNSVMLWALFMLTMTLLVLRLMSALMLMTLKVVVDGVGIGDVAFDFDVDVDVDTFEHSCSVDVVDACAACVMFMWLCVSGA